MNNYATIFHRSLAALAAVAISTSLFVSYFAVPGAHAVTGLVA